MHIQVEKRKNPINARAYRYISIQAIPIVKSAFDNSSAFTPYNTSLIVKNILLNNPCIFPIQGKWRYPSTFLLNGPKNPDIHRNAGGSSVGKEGNAVCHLYAYAHDSLQLFQQCRSGSSAMACKFSSPLLTFCIASKIYFTL